MFSKTTTKRALTFAMVGVILTVADYLLFLLFTYCFNQIMIASALAGVCASVLGFLLHNLITWKDRVVTKRNIIRFFIWNFAVLVALRPFLMWIFNLLLDPLCTTIYYSLNLSFMISVETFSYFVPYAVVTLITMTLNFIFYDRFVFGKENKHDGAN